MASTRLAEAVGYPGTSVAFAQLLSGMERDGLISREVRGKRTYRIAIKYPEDESAAPAAADAAAVPAAAGEADFDELADRVLVRLVRRLAELSPAELAILERLLVPGHARGEENQGDGPDERGSSLKIV